MNNTARLPVITGSVPAWAAPRRVAARAGAIAAAIGAAAITGCSASPAPAPGPTATPTITVTVPASPAAATAAPGMAATPATAPAPATATPGSPVPVLGRPAGAFAPGGGFGQTEPAKIFNGGDPTGLVTQIAWKSWGGPQAIGSGTSEYVGPGQSVATGTPQPVTVVAFHLGNCHGTLMYRAVEWYFPQHGQAFDPSHYQNICAGTYVPSQ